MKITHAYLAALASSILLMPIMSFSQVYKMTDGVTVNTCGGIFYDDGGPGGSDTIDLANNNYIDNKVMTQTFCSCNGNPIRFTFTNFKTETGFDSLIAYNGTNLLAPKIGGWHGNKFPGTITSSNAGNCITFFFASDFNNNRLGWAANISCTAGTTPTITASGPTTFCQGSNVTLTASSGTSYTWNTGSTAQSIVATTSGNYYVAVATGTCSAGATPVNVTVKPTPTVTVTGAATICPGTSTSLKVSGGSSYSWAPAGSLTNPNISNPFASPTTTTVYSVTATGSNGCTSMGNVTVTTKPAPLAAISGNNSICAGESTTLTASGAGTYSWNTGATTVEIIASPSSTANYSVTVTGSNGCTASASTAVTVNPSPAAPTITPSGTSLSSSTGVTYQWYFNSAIISGATNQVYNATQNGTYMVCVSDANGCSSCSAGYNMAVVGIGEGLQSLAPVIFPNPSTGNFKIQFQNYGEDEYSLEILNAFGQRVAHKNCVCNPGIFSEEFDLSGQGSGIYLCILRNASSIFTNRVIIY